MVYEDFEIGKEIEFQLNGISRKGIIFNVEEVADQLWVDVRGDFGEETVRFNEELEQI